MKDERTINELLSISQPNRDDDIDFNRVMVEEYVLHPMQEAKNKVDDKPPMDQGTGKNKSEFEPEKEESPVDLEESYADFDKDEVNYAFGLLQKALKGKKLNTSTGEKREAKPNEFMLMSADGKWYAFKHSFTRNYVFVERAPTKMPPKLDVPQTQKAFNRGEFDDPNKSSTFHPGGSFAEEFDEKPEEQEGTKLEEALDNILKKSYELKKLIDSLKTLDKELNVNVLENIFDSLLSASKHMADVSKIGYDSISLKHHDNFDKIYNLIKSISPKCKGLIETIKK